MKERVTRLEVVLALSFPPLASPKQSRHITGTSRHRGSVAGDMAGTFKPDQRSSD